MMIYSKNKTVTLLTYFSVASAVNNHILHNGVVKRRACGDIKEKSGGGVLLFFIFRF